MARLRNIDDINLRNVVVENHEETFHAGGVCRLTIGANVRFLDSIKLPE